MELRTTIIVLGVVVAGMLVSGCGMTGKTGVVEPRIEIPPSAGSAARICVDSITVAPRAATLQNIGTHAWGKFDEHDLENLEKGLRLMTAHVNESRPTTGNEQTLYVVIRSYQVATSNKSAAVLACVAWAMTNGERDILYHEQFYASHKSSTLGTVGGVKEAVHKALLTRIGRSAVLLSAGKTGELPAATDGTYLKAEDATRDLPGEMESILVATEGYKAVSDNIRWRSSQYPPTIDWSEYIESRLTRDNKK